MQLKKTDVKDQALRLGAGWLSNGHWLVFANGETKESLEELGAGVVHELTPKMVESVILEFNPDAEPDPARGATLTYELGEIDTGWRNHGPVGKRHRAIGAQDLARCYRGKKDTVWFAQSYVELLGHPTLAVPLRNVKNGPYALYHVEERTYVRQSGMKAETGTYYKFAGILMPRILE